MGVMKTIRTDQLAGRVFPDWFLARFEGSDEPAPERSPDPRITPPWIEEIKPEPALADPDAGQVAGRRSRKTNDDIGLAPVQRGVARLADDARAQARMPPAQFGQRPGGRGFMPNLRSNPLKARASASAKLHSDRQVIERETEGCGPLRTKWGDITGT